MDFPREIFYKKRVMIYDHEDESFVYYVSLLDHICFFFKKSEFFSLTYPSIVIISP